MTSSAPPAGWSSIPALSRAVIILSAIAGVLAIIATVLSVVAYSGLADQVDRGDRIARTVYTQRRRATLLNCIELERIKTDARILLASRNLPTELLPFRLDHRTRVFAANDCLSVVEERVPAGKASPGTDLSLPPIPAA